MKRLGEATNYVDYRGKTPTKTLEGIFLITAKNVRDGYLDYDISQEFVSAEGYEEIMRRGKPKVGDVVITTEAPLGNVAVIDREDIALAQRVIKFRGKLNILDNSYLRYYFLSPDFQKSLEQKATGSTAKGIKGSVLHKMGIPLPPLPEQRRIAAVLGTWDRAIEQTTNLLKQLRIRHRGLMQRLLTGKVRLPGFDEEWKHVELGDLFERVSRRNAEGNTNVLTISAQQGLVSQGRYFNKNIASEVVTNYFLLHKGEFAYNKSYSAGYPMGVLKRLEQYEKGIVSPLYICFRLRDNAENYASFFVHFFEAGCLNQNISEIAQEGARNHGLLNVGVSDFFGVRLVVPSTVDEQHAIARILDASLREIRQQEAKLDALREQKRGLMQCLLTGQVRVPEGVPVPEAV